MWGRYFLWGINLWPQWLCHKLTLKGILVSDWWKHSPNMHWRVGLHNRSFKSHGLLICTLSNFVFRLLVSFSFLMKLRITTISLSKILILLLSLSDKKKAISNTTTIKIILMESKETTTSEKELLLIEFISTSV